MFLFRVVVHEYNNHGFIPHYIWSSSGVLVFKHVDLGMLINFNWWNIFNLLVILFISILTKYYVWIWTVWRAWKLYETTRSFISYSETCVKLYRYVKASEFDFPNVGILWIYLYHNCVISFYKCYTLSRCRCISLWWCLEWDRYYVGYYLVGRPTRKLSVYRWIYPRICSKIYLFNNIFYLYTCINIINYFCYSIYLTKYMIFIITYT